MAVLRAKHGGYLRAIKNEVEGVGPPGHCSRRQRVSQQDSPEGDIRSIIIDEIGQLGLDESNNLYWCGKRVVVMQVYKLTTGKFVYDAILMASAVVVGLYHAILRARLLIGI